MRKYFSNHEMKKFYKIKREYMKLGYPAWKAEEYSNDHLFIDRKAVDVYARNK